MTLHSERNFLHNRTTISPWCPGVNATLSFQLAFALLNIFLSFRLMQVVHVCALVILLCARALLFIFLLTDDVCVTFSLLFKALHLLCVVFLASIFVGRNCAHIRCSAIGIGLKWIRNHFRVHITVTTYRYFQQRQKI